jgi:hypothetical protein
MCENCPPEGLCDNCIRATNNLIQDLDVVIILGDNEEVIGDPMVEIDYIHVWHGHSVSKFLPSNMLQAAQFAFRKDGLVVWGDWPNTQVRHPKAILAPLN